MIVEVSTPQIANAAVRAAARRGEVLAGGAGAMRLWSKVVSDFGGRGKREVLLIDRGFESSAVALNGRVSHRITREAADLWRKGIEPSAAPAPDAPPGEPEPSVPAGALAAPLDDTSEVHAAKAA